MNQCEVTLEVGLADKFVAVLEHLFRSSGYRKVVDYSNPDGPDVVGFQLGNSVLTLELREEGEGQQRVSVHSEDVDCPIVFRQAAIACGAELIAALFSSFTALPSRKVHDEAQSALTDLAQRLT